MGWATNSLVESMLHSLRARLVFMTVVVAVIAVTCVGLLSRRFTLTDFNTYVSNTQQVDLERFRTVLVEHYHQRGGWLEAQSLVERLGTATDKQLILVDAQRKLLSASPAGLLQANVHISLENDLTWRREERRGHELIVDEMVLRNVPHIALNDSSGLAIGTLFVTPIFSSPAADRREDVFVSGLNRTLLLAALASAFVALLIAVILSRRIVRPIEALTKAVHQMERGDLSQRVETSSRDEIGELSHAFNAMADSLTHAEQLRRNLVNDVAHELRTPLTNIRCQIEALQDALASPTPQMIDSLHEEAMLLNRLIDDLQDLALAEAGQISLELRRISVKEEVAQAVYAAEQTKNSGPSIQIEVADTCPDVLADSQRLRQILRNLLKNAITHTSANGMILVRASQLDSRVEIAIEDTGSGISSDDLPYVFERFYRADSSRSRDTGGAGLGLAIVKQIVAAHGGETCIESVVGRGTNIRFYLPIFVANP